MVETRERTKGRQQLWCIGYPFVSSRNNDGGKSKDQFHHLLLD
jgi:hypothetical protein